MIFLLLLAIIPNVSSQLCQQCANRRLQYSAYPQQRNYNFNFEKFFSQFPGFTAPQKPAPSTFSSAPSAFNSNSRTFNVYGQDAEAFGSAIGKSIGQRIQQAFGNQQDTSPTYDVQFTPPSSPDATSSTSYASMTPSTSSYGSSSTYQSTYPTSSATWQSTHPPEDLPTVQQAYQAQQASYGSTPSIQQIPQSLTGNSNGFGGLPGLLPPPQNSDCPWCSQGYRGKRIPSEKEEKKEEKI
ncbi:unnamed protein product [Caenorhabditis nigoni]|uniref:Uncharacterized protein n=1 Tax=Caenorhabditis nigoni TaxID=1611254 RepID=A0A2G5VU89_9PELO|nr:hypothetical protein B9Z55_000662 [Caenorhabditis nigoni]